MHRPCSGLYLRLFGLALLGLALAACSATPISIPGQADGGTLKADSIVSPYIDAGAADGPTFWPDAGSPDAAGDGASDALGNDGVGDGLQGDAGGDAVGGDGAAGSDATTGDATPGDAVVLPPG